MEKEVENIVVKDTECASVRDVGAIFPFKIAKSSIRSPQLL